MRLESADPLPLVCVVCGARLAEADASGLRCLGCQQAYPSVLGITDVRHPARRADGSGALAAQLLDAFDSATFEELVRLYFELFPPTPSRFHAKREQFREHRLHQAERGKKFVQMFLAEARQKFGATPGRAVLEIGCGSGAGLVELAQHFAIVAGLDPDLPSLVMSRKTLDEHGCGPVRLFHGFGQNLPFAPGTFDCVIAMNALEHILEPDVVVQEIERVLAPGGVFVADSRNRFDLFFPEPHTGLRWVGWLPRGWAKRYVLWRTGIPYDHTWLLSYHDLSRSFRRHFGGDNYSIDYPDIAAYGYSARAGQVLRIVERLPVLGRLLLAVFPTYIVVARKTA